jgi:hypothetical protein
MENSYALFNTWTSKFVISLNVIRKCYFLGIPLYDYSGVKLDSNSYQLLDYCGNQLHHLTTLFQGVLKMCKNPTVQGNKLIWNMFY